MNIHTKQLFCFHSYSVKHQLFEQFKLTPLRDEPSNYIERFDLHFLECDHCHKRKCTVTGTKRWKYHPGIIRTKQNYEIFGIIPS